MKRIALKLALVLSASVMLVFALMSYATVVGAFGIRGVAKAVVSVTQTDAAVVMWFAAYVVARPMFGYALHQLIGDERASRQLCVLRNRWMLSVALMICAGVALH